MDQETALTVGKYLLAGALAPALAVLGVQALRLPGLRHAAQGIAVLAAGAILVPLQALRAASYAAGKIASVTLTRWIPKGQALEDGLQGFVEASMLGPAFGVLGAQVDAFLRWLVFSPFWNGLDADDVGVKLKQAAELAVVTAEKALIVQAADGEARAETLAAAATSHVRASLGDQAKKVGERAIKEAVKRATSRTAVLRAGKLLLKVL